jgi:hypothetical protein
MLHSTFFGAVVATSGGFTIHKRGLETNYLFFFIFFLFFSSPSYFFLSLSPLIPSSPFFFLPSSLFLLFFLSLPYSLLLVSCRRRGLEPTQPPLDPPLVATAVFFKRNVTIG